MHTSYKVCEANDLNYLADLVVTLEEICMCEHGPLVAVGYFQKWTLW